MAGPIETFMTADHVRIDDLLAKAELADAGLRGVPAGTPATHRHVRRRCCSPVRMQGEGASPCPSRPSSARTMGRSPPCSSRPRRQPCAPNFALFSRVTTRLKRTRWALRDARREYNRRRRPSQRLHARRDRRASDRCGVVTAHEWLRLSKPRGAPQSTASRPPAPYVVRK